MNESLKVNCWDGRTVDVKRIYIYAAKDQNEKIFFKIEGIITENASCMIAYYYDRKEAIKKFMELIEELLKIQSEGK